MRAPRAAAIVALTTLALLQEQIAQLEAERSKPPPDVPNDHGGDDGDGKRKDDGGGGKDKVGGGKDGAGGKDGSGAGVSTGNGDGDAKGR
jgi:hypothetical protein